LKDKSGNWQTDPAVIATLFVEYYEEILGNETVNRRPATGELIRKGMVLAKEQQCELIKSFEPAKVKKAIFQIDSNKSPGPDGFGSGFYKSAWPIVGEDVTNAVLEFFQNSKILRQINSTSIALIPKIDKPEFASQFRPISCCNVIYKCISKLICSRLKSAISIIVAENQSAFVQGRSMMHNVLICHDILRHYNRKNASPRCLMKIDLKKAYDMVSLEFLEEVLIHFGFPGQFVKWIMLGVTTTMFSVKVNGGSHGFFAGRRGLRQGDPISPLLFVLVMEYLSRTLHTMSQLPDFKYHPMCKKLKLTYLIFADDLMIFCKGYVDSVNRVMETLAHFNAATGLEANLEKSNVYLAGVDERVKMQILARTGFSEGVFPIKYLGLPLSPKKWKKIECWSLIDKITHRIKVTYSKQLSYAGRLQVINAVLFSIHSFWGAVFILPQSILKKVDQICRDFLWGSSAEKKKVALVAWDKVCLPKRQGGLNIKGCSNWNKASVGQLLWQIIVNKESLWVKWVHDIYMKNDTSIWTHKTPIDCNWYWRKINALKEHM